MLKPRKVVVTIELLTDDKLADIKQEAYNWWTDKVVQVQVNVVKGGGK